MTNYFLLAGLILFVACTEGHQNMELSDAVEQARITLIQDEKKLIHKASHERLNLINELQEDSSFAHKVSLSQKYISQLPIELRISTRSESLNRADTIYDLTSSLEQITYDVRIKNISPLKINSEHQKAFYALAASLHHSKNDSLLNIIKSTFNPESSSELNLREDSLELLVELMKARADILGALALQEIKEAGFSINLIAQKFLNQTKSNNESIDLGAESKLQLAIQTKNFLKSVGISYKLDFKTKLHLRDAKVRKKLKLSEEEKAKIELIKKQIEELVR